MKVLFCLQMSPGLSLFVVDVLAAHVLTHTVTLASGSVQEGRVPSKGGKSKYGLLSWQEKHKYPLG